MALETQTHNLHEWGITEPLPASPAGETETFRFAGELLLLLFDDLVFCPFLSGSHFSLRFNEKGIKSRGGK